MTDGAPTTRESPAAPTATGTMPGARGGMIGDEPRAQAPMKPPAPPPQWAGLAAWLGKWYPEVRPLPVETLATWLACESQVSPLLIDVRSPAEQAVSTLPGALCVDGEAAALRALAGYDRDQPVVTYCAVGVRAARLAQSLQREGYTQVFNLEGAIFEWAHRGLPLVCGGRPTRLVHPFDRQWGGLLDPMHHPGRHDLTR